MAKGRMLNREVSLSVKFDALPNDTARLIATWIIPHLDKNGVFHANPQVVKSLILPLRQDITAAAVGRVLEDMERVGLIVRFESTGRVWQAWPGFDHNQPYLRKDKEKTDFPPPPACVPTNSDKIPTLSRQIPTVDGEKQVQIEVEEERKGKEVEGADAPPAVIPFSDPDPMTRAARAAGIGSQPSPRSAAAKKAAAAQFDIGVLEDAPAIKVHRDVCGYVPMTPEQAREIVAGVNGDAETGWRDNLTFWMAKGYRADNLDGQTKRHLEQGKRSEARAKQPAAPQPGQWQPAKGMYPQAPDRTPEQMAEIHRQDLERTKARKAAPDTVTIVNGVEVPF